MRCLRDGNLCILAPKVANRFLPLKTMSKVPPKWIISLFVRVLLLITLPSTFLYVESWYQDGFHGWANFWPHAVPVGIIPARSSRTSRFLCRPVFIVEAERIFSDITFFDSFRWISRFLLLFLEQISNYGLSLSLYLSTKIETLFVFDTGYLGKK